MIGSKLHMYTRILVAFVGAILVSEFLVRDVFLGATPNVRPDLADRFVERTLALVNVDNYLALFRRGAATTNNIANNTPASGEQSVEEPLRPTLIRGVYAKETSTEVITEIHYEEVQWVDVDYTTKDGTVEKIKIPAGTQPPPPGLF
jgi:hypothetical protein